MDVWKAENRFVDFSARARSIVAGTRQMAFRHFGGLIKPSRYRNTTTFHTEKISSVLIITKHTFNSFSFQALKIEQENNARFIKIYINQVVERL